MFPLAAKLALIAVASVIGVASFIGGLVLVVDRTAGAASSQLAVGLILIAVGMIGSFFAWLVLKLGKLDAAVARIEGKLGMTDS